MDGIQLTQGYSHYEKAVYFLPQIISSTSEVW